MKHSTMLWVGAAVIVGGAVAAVVYEKNKNASPTPPGPALPVGTMTPTTVFNTGGKYGLAGQIGAGVNSSADLVAAFAKLGWSGVQVVYFGPTGGGVPAGMPFLIPGSPATGYIVSGVWGGANNTPVPTGVVAVSIA